MLAVRPRPGEQVPPTIHEVIRGHYPFDNPQQPGRPVIERMGETATSIAGSSP